MEPRSSPVDQPGWRGRCPGVLVKQQSCRLGPRLASLLWATAVRIRSQLSAGGRAVGSNPPLPSDSSSRLVRPQRLRSMTTSSSAMPAEFQHQAPEHGHVRRDPHGTVTPARPSSPTPPTWEAASLPLDRAGSCAFATCRVLRVAEGCPRRVRPVQGAPAAGPRGLDRRLESASGRRTRRARARDADGRLGRRVRVSSDSPDA